jgi:hypothetical protein
MMTSMTTATFMMTTMMVIGRDMVTVVGGSLSMMSIDRMMPMRSVMMQQMMSMMILIRLEGRKSHEGITHIVRRGSYFHSKT